MRSWLPGASQSATLFSLEPKIGYGEELSVGNFILHEKCFYDRKIIFVSRELYSW